MNICVLGLWHLGCVTAACLASLNMKVVGLDFDEETIKNIRKFKFPIFEPGLDKLVKKSIKNKKLFFTSTANDLPEKIDYVWVTYDTPVNSHDKSNTKYVLENLHKLLKKIKKNTTIIISSQLPAGSVRSLQKYYGNKFDFVVIPENLRLGDAINAFFGQERLLVGISNRKIELKLRKLLSPICEQIHFMRVESAEMSKHAINSFLAMSISFANEIANISEMIGADYREVELGLRSEKRIGFNSYLSAGAAFSGGTLARDVEYLKQIANKKGEHSSDNISLIKSIKKSNQHHKKWVLNKINSLFSKIKNKRITLLGLSYKENSNTLRRSLAVEIGNFLIKKGAKLSAFDPLVKELPTNWVGKVNFFSDLFESMHNAEILIVCSNLDSYKRVKMKNFIKRKKNICIIDQNRFFTDFYSIKNIKYFCVGSPEN